jgi:hypothetical protein
MAAAIPAAHPGTTVSELYDQPDDPADTSSVATETRPAPAELDDTARTEPMSRDDYADSMREGPPAETLDGTDDPDTYDSAPADPDADVQEISRDEYTDQMRQGPSAETEDHGEEPEPAGDRSDERETVGETDAARGDPDTDAQGMTRDDYADLIRQGPSAETDEVSGDDGARTGETDHLDDSEPLEPPAPGQSAEEQSRNDPGQDFVKGEDPYAQVSVVQLEPADRTLGDTTPTGIGLKPTGDQLMRMEGDGQSALERIRRNIYDRADDINDSGDEYGDDLGKLFQRPPTESHTEVAGNPPATADHQDHVIDGGHVANAAFVVGLVAYEVFRHSKTKIEARRKK